MKQTLKVMTLVLIVGFSIGGCAGGPTVDTGWVSNTAFSEAEWVRNGETLSMEGQYWIPQDGVENILDSEVYPIGEYQGVQIFVEYTDVKPFDQLYSRFAKNKYRIFQKKESDD